MPAGRAAVLSRPVDHPGLQLLKSATAWYDIASENTAPSTAQWVLNRSNQGGLNARLGSVGRIELRGSAGLLNSGVTGNYALRPGSAALNITGDIDIRVKMQPSDWAGTAGCPVARDTVTGSGHRVWAFWAATNIPAWSFWDGGGNQRDRGPGAAVPFTGSQAGWVRVTLDVDNGAGGNTTTFYTSTDGINWTILGTPQVVAGTTTISSSATEPICMAAARTTGAFHNTFSGGIHRIQVLNGINGTPVLDADFTTATPFAASFTESSSNAATVTLTAAAGEGSDTNDPTKLDFSSEIYAYFPGLTGNLASAPGTASAVSQLQIIADFFLPAVPNRGMIASIGTSAIFYDNTLSGGRLTVIVNDSGQGPSSATFNLNVPKNTRMMARWTVQIGGLRSHLLEVSFDNGVTWPMTVSGVGTADPVNSNWGVASYSAGGWNFEGKVYSAQFAKDGTTQARFSLVGRSSSDTSWVDSFGVTWNFLRSSASGRRSVIVTRPVMLFGGDDYLEISDSPSLNVGASDSLTAILVGRLWNNPTSYSALITKRTDVTSGAGWGVFLNDVALDVYAYWSAGGVVSDTSGASWTSGQLVTVGMIKDVPNDKIRSILNSTITVGTADTTSTSGTNVQALRIGRDSSGVGASYAAMELVGVAIFKNTVLTSQNLADINSYYGV